jgi:hypothetical protein
MRLLGYISDISTNFASRYGPVENLRTGLFLYNCYNMPNLNKLYINNILDIISDKSLTSSNAYKYNIRNNLSIHLWLLLCETNTNINYDSFKVDYRVALWHPIYNNLTDIISLKEYCNNKDNILLHEMELRSNYKYSILSNDLNIIDILNDKKYIVIYQCLCNSSEEFHTSRKIDANPKRPNAHCICFDIISNCVIKMTNNTDEKDENIDNKEKDDTNKKYEVSKYQFCMTNLKYLQKSDINLRTIIQNSLKDDKYTICTNS